MGKNKNGLNNSDEENVIRSLGHNALIELLNNNNEMDNDIEHEFEHEHRDDKNKMNEINLFEINNCVDTDSENRKKSIRKHFSRNLFNKLAYNQLYENDENLLSYDDNLKSIQTECSRRKYFNTIDKSRILLSKKGTKLLMHDHINKNINKNLITINNMNGSLTYDAELYNILKKKRKLRCEMLENHVEPENDITQIKKKIKDALCSNMENHENEKSKIISKYNSVCQSSENYDTTISENVENSIKDKDNMKDDNVQNSTKKNNLKGTNSNTILYDNKKDTKEINNLNNYQDENGEKDREKNVTNKKINGNSLILEKRKSDKYLVKIEEIDLIADKTHLIQNENQLKHVDKSENTIKNIPFKKEVNSENFIFLDFNPVKKDYIEINKLLKTYKKNYNVLYTKKENYDAKSNHKNNSKEECIETEQVESTNVEQAISSEPSYIKKKFDYLKESLLKKSINIINYDFENNLCYILIKKSSTL